MWGPSRRRFFYPFGPSFPFFPPVYFSCFLFFHFSHFLFISSFLIFLSFSFSFFIFLKTKDSSFLFSCISFKYVLLLALVSEFNCFLRSRCSMEMWCPDDIGRDSWDWVGPPAWGEHASTLQSGVEAPRLLKRSLQRLYFCCCGCCCCWRSIDTCVCPHAQDPGG